MRTANRTATAGADDWRTVFQSRDVTWLWAGQVISQIGEGLSKLALWFVYYLTGSALKMTVVGILQTLPPLILGPFIGIYPDRVSKRNAMIAIDLARACLIILIPTLYAFGWLALGRLYVLVFVIALFSSAYGPALSAALPPLVHKQQLTRVNALMQSSITIGQLLGPAASGILIATIDAQNVLYVTAGAFFLSCLCKIPVTIPHRPTPSSSNGMFDQVGQALIEGLRFIFVRNRLLVVALAEQRDLHHNALAAMEKTRRPLRPTLDVGDGGTRERSRGPHAPFQQLAHNIGRFDRYRRSRFGLSDPLSPPHYKNTCQKT